MGRWGRIGWVLVLGCGVGGCLKDEEKQASPTTVAPPPPPEAQEEPKQTADDQVAGKAKQRQKSEAERKSGVTLGEITFPNGAEAGVRAGEGGRKVTSVQGGEATPKLQDAPRRHPPESDRLGPGAPSPAPLPSSSEDEPEALAASAAGTDYPQEEVRKVAEEHIDGIARCFDDALAQSSEGAGADRGVQAVLNMTIDAQGLVSAASVESDAGERLKECLVTEAKAWKFAPPQGTVKVRYPLSFQPPR